MTTSEALTSGAGLVGLCAAALGASVTLTDLPGQCELVTANVTAAKVNAKVMPLEWGEPTPDGWCAGQFDIVTTCFADHGVIRWCAVLLQVLGSDLAYNDDSTSRLARTLASTCTADTIVILAHR